MVDLEELKGLVERLREQFSRVGFGLLAHEAADTLESLAAENERLRKALDHTASILTANNPVLCQIANNARKALSGGSEG